MLGELKNSLWTQFGASIEMLMASIESCPEELYGENKRFYHVAYHVTVFLDYYLTIPPKDFWWNNTALLSFTIKESDEIPEGAVDDIVPNRFYEKKELLGYLRACHEKCQELILGLSEEGLKERFKEEFGFGNMDYSIIEILFYNLRHVQHHVGQLNMILRNEGHEPPKWVARVS